MVFSNNLLMGAAGQSTGYEIDQSIRFNDNDSAYLTRTPGSAGNRRTWTLSWWVKRANLGSRMQMFSITASGGIQGIIEFDLGDGPSTDQLILNSETSGTTALNWELEWKFRDPAAWYHFVMVYDTTQATTNDRVKVYVNGEQAVDGWDRNSTPAQNQEQAFNSTNAMNIGKPHAAISAYFDGYMSEIHFIDGQALDASYFGETNADGVWVPIAYTGSYGTNGFYITGATDSDLGEDFSGNNNDFTSSGLATTDQMLDTPTLNFPTFNPLNVDAYTLSDGNLNTGAAGDAGAVSTFAIDVTDSDGFYFEVSSSTAATYPDIGLQDADALALAGATTISDYNTGRYTYQGNTGNFNDQGSTSSYGATYTTNTIGVLVQSGNLYFSKDGVIQNSGTAAKTGLTGMMYARVSYSAGSGTQANFTANFGQSAFAHDPGSTYKAWNTANLATPSIKDGSAHFDTSLWAGNSTDGRAITGYNFQPDWVWIKARNNAYSHNITDAVRGAGIYLQSNSTDPEVTGPGAFGSTLAFTSDGFTLDNGTVSNLYVNQTGTNYVGWAWKANGAGSSNTDGDITSTVSANTTAGFSIATYTGNASSSQTIGHGLGQIPSLVMFKELDSSSYSWQVYHASLGYTQRLILDATNAAVSATNIFSAAPTSTVFTIGNSAGINTNSASHVMYSFAEIPGYSSIGSYTGNGSSTNVVYTGFKPAFVIGKRVSGSGGYFDWWIFDGKRPGYNLTNLRIYPNLSFAEDSGTGNLDFVSNGFVIRSNTSSMNNSGDSFVFAAFAEHPFGGDGAAPATAR